MRLEDGVTARQQFERGEMNEGYAKHYEGEAAQAAEKLQHIKDNLSSR